MPKFGWIKDDFDERDLSFLPKLFAVPKKVDLRKYCPTVYDQGNLGSCTGQAVGALLHLTEIKNKTSNIFMPSRLFLYYGGRLAIGTVNEDSGAQIRDVVKYAASTGVCGEVLYPHKIADFKKKPSQAAMKEAKKNTIDKYERVQQSRFAIQSALAESLPVVFGFKVYSSFMGKKVAETGLVPMPTRKEKIQGGHAILIVGYDDSKSHYIFRNSWGDWGDKGYGYMPYEYVENSKLSSDFWIVRKL